MNNHSLVPQPKTFGPLGNLPQIDKEAPVQSMLKLAQEYGPIFKLTLPNGEATLISGYDLVAEACDQSRFDKKISPALTKVRAFTGDGLFTAETEEPNWKKAHHILLPSFSQRAMIGYHHMMVDIATQLIQKWSRLNPDESIDVPADMTRLTLDTIGLCGFNYRFNSFYREQPHPFITSLVRTLAEAMSQLQRFDIQDRLMILSKRQLHKDIQSMYALVDNLIAERREHGTQGIDDLLSHMLNGKDPETGEGLDDENIRYQIITFLIAGHETTSGLLSFALYFLLKNPDKLQKAYEEVDRVLKDPIPTYAQVRELRYIRMILNESLRLWPTAPVFALYPKEDTTLAGKYPFKKGDTIEVLIPALHRDRRVWGEDVEAFRPERFADQDQIPHDAFKPFGNGQRACIGQQFAMHEATLVLGLVLKYFQIIDHTNYQLKIKETLTLKPEGFTMRVQPRTQDTITMTGQTPATSTEDTDHELSSAGSTEAHDSPMLVLYGSNLGTAEGIAREIADSAKLQGFQTEVATLNERVGKLPKQGAVIIVAASYNGKAPNNAREFVQWLEGLESGELNGVHYAVFGCGDRNWASTYQKIPRLIDQQLADKGARRLTDRGEGDASGDFDKQLEDWRSHLWPDVMQGLSLSPSAKTVKTQNNSLTIQFVSELSTPLADLYNAQPAMVVENHELQAANSKRSTRHIELELPDGVSYREGDHLGVLPRNRRYLVERVLRRFRLNGSDYVYLRGSGRSALHLPLDRPISLYDLLSQYVELQEPATRGQLRELAAYTVCPPHKKELEGLQSDDSYKDHVLDKRISMLDLLEKYEACELPFERFLELLPQLKPRYYSISSSPRVRSDRVSITVGVVRDAAWNDNGEYLGVASNFLASRHVGDRIDVFIRTPESGFQLPDNPETPVIMVGAGTGIAPFRGFLQARHSLQQEKKRLGSAHLYFGCRSDRDYSYRDELESYQEEGIVQLHTAFSRKEGTPKTYVQHVMEKNADEIIQLLDQGARLYICGDGRKMTPDVERTLKKAYQERHGVDEPASDRWLKSLEADGQYTKDVWTNM